MESVFNSISRVFLGALLLFAVVSCGDSGDPTPDEQVFGTWSDEIITYTFTPEKTYGAKVLVDNPLDTANLDSTFGIFSSDKDNRVLSLTVKGYKLENGTLIDTLSIGPTWVYNIEEAADGTYLYYQSNTSIGKLKKID